MVEAGSCLVEFNARISDGLGRLVSDAFSAGPSSRGAWVDYSIFTSLWGVLAEEVVYSWRLIKWNQLRGNALPESVTLMLAMAVEDVGHCRQITIASITHPGLACSVWSVGS